MKNLIKIIIQFLIEKLNHFKVSEVLSVHITHLYLLFIYYVLSIINNDHYIIIFLTLINFYST
jgi:hypothetical protein